MHWIVPDALTSDCEKSAEICASDERGDGPIAAENLLHGGASRLADVPEDWRSLPVQMWLGGPFRQRRRPNLFSSPFDKLRARALLTPLPRRRHHNLVGSSSKRSLANPPTSRRSWPSLLVALGLPVVLAIAFFVLRPRSGGNGAPGTFFGGTSRNPLNVVVVTLDTTRADRIGAYGAKDVETPAFDRLASEGVLFEQAVSVAPLTLPAHSSMFTGKFPPEHGVRDNGGFFLGPEQVTLAERLKARGYRTGAFIAAYVLDWKWGIDQGFDTFFDDFDLSQRRGFSLGRIQRPANEVMDKALPWIQQDPGKPFFAWIHLYDAHAPFNRRRSRFSRGTKDGRTTGEIAFADSQVGRLVAQLESSGVYDRTIVMVIGDHGESLDDHGEASHGFFIYNSVTHVPFVIRTPFGQRIQAARRRSGSKRRLDAYGAGPGLARTSGRDLRREPDAADDAARSPSSASTPTRRRCIPSTTTGGATFARSGRAATR